MYNIWNRVYRAVRTSCVSLMVVVVIHMRLFSGLPVKYWTWSMLCFIPSAPQAEGILWPKLHKGKRSTCSPVISPALYLQQFSPKLKYEPVEPERNPKKILQRTSLSDISSSPDYFFLSPSPSFHFYLEKCFFLHSQTDLLNRWLANSSDLIRFFFGHIPWLSDLSSPTWVRTWAMAVKRVNSHH